MSPPELAQRLLSGDTRALARAISLIEERSAEAPALLREVFPATGKAFVVGVTGFPGAGKSSLVDRLTAAYRAQGSKVGVIAVDPSSAFSGGAILGDRIRMMRHSTDPGVFIRSMATRGAMGGLSRATADTIDLMDAAGYEIVLVETVGVGQDEIDVVRTADTVLVVLVPGMGDDIQAIKAGILEIADIFVVNKSDQGGADRLEAELRTMMSLSDTSERREIMRTVAVRDEGTVALVEAIARHRATSETGGGGSMRRIRQSQARFMDLLRERLLDEVVERCLPGDATGRLGEEIASRRLDPYAAVETVLARLIFVGAAAQGPGRFTGIDHIGIAVQSLAQRVPLYRDVLGLALSREEDVPSERVRVAFFGSGETHVELLEPLDGTGPIADALVRRGEGIHHLCFAVDDIEKALERVRAAGLLVIGEAPRPGAGGCRVAFLQPRGTGGVLVELSEKPR